MKGSGDLPPMRTISPEIFEYFPSLHYHHGGSR